MPWCHAPRRVQVRRRVRRGRGGLAGSFAWSPGMPSGTGPKQGWTAAAVGRFRMRGIGIVVGALCAAVVLSGCASSKRTKERMAVLDAENTDLRQQNDQMTSQLQQSQAESDRLAAQMQQAEA